MGSSQDSRSKRISAKVTRTKDEVRLVQSDIRQIYKWYDPVGKG